MKEIIFIMVISLCAYMVGSINGYKDGQIDALSGTIRYELVKLPNGEMRWMEKK